MLKEGQKYLVFSGTVSRLFKKKQNKKSTVLGLQVPISFNTTRSFAHAQSLPALSHAVKAKSKDILTPTALSNRNPSVSIWIFQNIGRSFWELSSTKTFRLPYQDHSQSTFLRYHILNY